MPFSSHPPVSPSAPAVSPPHDELNTPDPFERDQLRERQRDRAPTWPYGNAPVPQQDTRDNAPLPGPSEGYTADPLTAAFTNTTAGMVNPSATQFYPTLSALFSAQSPHQAVFDPSPMPYAQATSGAQAASYGPHQSIAQHIIPAPVAGPSSAQDEASAIYGWGASVAVPSERGLSVYPIAAGHAQPPASPIWLEIPPGYEYVAPPEASQPSTSHDAQPEPAAKRGRLDEHAGMASTSASVQGHQDHLFPDPKGLINSVSAKQRAEVLSKLCFLQEKTVANPGTVDDLKRLGLLDRVGGMTKALIAIAKNHAGNQVLEKLLDPTLRGKLQTAGLLDHEGRVTDALVTISHYSNSAQNIDENLLFHLVNFSIEL